MRRIRRFSTALVSRHSTLPSPSRINPSPPSRHASSASPATTVTHTPSASTSSVAPSRVCTDTNTLRSPDSPPPHSELHHDPEDPLFSVEEAFDLDEYIAPLEEAPSPPRSRYDWRGRASSRRRPGGLIDPSLKEGGKVAYPRRHKFPVQPISMGEKWYDEIENYKARFLPLLAAEQETEATLIRTRLANWPQDKLKRDGYCLTGLSSFWLQENQFGKPAAAFLLGPGIALPYHRFENGTQVILSRLDPLQALTGQGSVIGSSETEIRISFDEKMDLSEDTWRLDLFTTDIAYHRMRAAIQSLNYDPEEQERVSTEQVESVLMGTYLRDVLLPWFVPPRLDSFAPPQASASTAPPQASAAGSSSSFAPSCLGSLERADLKLDKDPMQRSRSRPPIFSPGIFGLDQRIHSWARRYRVLGDPVVVDGDPDLGTLNATQRRAVALMLEERVSLVQGPPGTGKTRTIIEAVKLLKTHFLVPHPILICTYTNPAVDTLVAGLAAAGLTPLRIGASPKIPAALRGWTLDARLERHPGWGALQRVRQGIGRSERWVGGVRDRLQLSTVIEKGVSGKEAEETRVRRAALHAAVERGGRDLKARKRRAWAMHREMVQDVVSKADVICTTCLTAATAVLDVVDFPVVFLDEASMSTEPASLIPLMKGSRHVALIGDHKQLPPVITSRKAQAGGLGMSLFERLTEEKVVPSIMLDLQYRMHPSLSRFPSSEFYNYSLFDGTVNGAGEVSSQLLPPSSSHLATDPETGYRPSMIFLDHAGNEEMKDRSRVNKNEARIVCAVIEDLLMHNPKMMGSDIGIIAPYAAQISLLERLLKANSAYREQLEGLLGPLRAMQVANIEVKTVDGFEGREKDVIIFSTVRNNAKGHIGFLADRRRMNVGLTRARRGLFVVGSVGTLRREGGMGLEGGSGGGRGRGKEGDVWVRYVDWMRENGAVKVLKGDTLARILGRT